MNPWQPMTNSTDLKVLGKFGEELGECSAAVSRCIIQGIDESEPTTDKLNRDWLQEEIADVLAGIMNTVGSFHLDTQFIERRSLEKLEMLKKWNNM